ncbi:Cytochrome P450 family 78 subfamily A polypeptide 6 [Tripterygium wilfordii]|uniref:Cytochrome P450 family 78 subfamily A polypeptide 6 n=1 Tax=Tripterygium wilfordii TaxID=458696 RepID=A0A7J7DCA5_TRIWF|nr:cytochrome P450 78A3-like [Tripterygium wilfordii]KAF5743888.1 Cytochrome P450 family 78 subfamily A polypeptide 6 [Tripterygium wilfordii]
MTTEIDSLWIFALASKCKSLTHETIFLPILIIALAWLAMALIYWAHSGGPAWGKYMLRKATSTKIPGPRGLPLIGSMNLMGSLAHHRLAAAAESCDAKRLMAFSLGDTRLILTCNPEVAKELLNSSVFADRPIKESAYSLMFNRAIGFANYGVYWRTLRRIAGTHLFCPKQIKVAEMQRQVLASQMVTVFGNKQESFGVRELIKRASLNNMMCSVFGRKYELNSSSWEVEELKELVDEGYDLLGLLNWTDHLPWLANFDLQKIRSRCSNLVPRVNKFVGKIIAEHRAESAERSPDFVDVLLSLQGADKLSDSDMISVLWEMIFRGTDTVAVLIEWVLARMVLHTDIQSKVHDELDRVVGSRAVTEADIAAMEYLPAVVKEVLRMHPPGPLLSWARLAITDTTIDGYHVPAGTTAMVNMWAITRDPEVWENPLEFNPERFVAKDEKVEFSVLGSDLRLAPFGSGRRVCPGKNLGLTTVNCWVASLLQEFEWLPSDQKGVDLSEVLKLSCEMANPLTVQVRPRRMMSTTQ